ncbi:MAG: imidazole glycerol phosphate synthase subunit HisH [Halothiobacillaceae bacterium]|nr:MAG: imidazole glycerol phosphate synthase subunit HisH [Halothiobacillaceae bacterium]
MNQPMVAVVDYGMGNLRSVAKAIEHVAPAGMTVRVTEHPDDLANADRIVFPGQGAARDCMLELGRRELRDALLEAARSKPFLGICMGMQVLMSHSEENGGTDCLGMFPGEVRFFGHGLKGPEGEKLKIPHMGWNGVRQARPHPIWEGIPDGERFYFVHSYHVAPAEPDLALGITDYGPPFVSAIARDNVAAVQFHPEKSAEAGLRLLGNFLRWNP